MQGVDAEALAGAQVAQGDAHRRGPGDGPGEQGDEREGGGGDRRAGGM
jgi:hypothetical protein